MNKLKAKARKYEREFDTHHRNRSKEIDWRLIAESLKTANDDAEHARCKAIKAFMKAGREKEEADEKERQMRRKVQGKRLELCPLLLLYTPTRRHTDFL